MCCVLFVLIIATISDFSQSFALDENSNKLYDLDWQCDTICLGSGGKARFDPKNKICKCTMDKNTDETEIQLMQKNARDMGLQIITCENYRELEKRDINEKLLTKKEEERVGVQLPKLPTMQELNAKFSEKLKPLSRNAAVPDTKKLDFTRKSIFSNANNIETSSNKESVEPIKQTFNLTARLMEFQKMHAKKLDELFPQGLFPHIKQRNGFELDPKKVIEPRRSEIHKVLDVAKEKRKELLDKYFDRRSRLLGNTRHEDDSKKSVAQKSQSPIDDNQISDTSSQNNMNHQIHGHQPALPNKNLIITQPPGTYSY